MTIWGAPRAVVAVNRPAGQIPEFPIPSQSHLVPTHERGRNPDDIARTPCLEFPPSSSVDTY